MLDFFSTIAGAAQAEIRSPESISYAPVTWALLTVVAALVAIMYADLKASIKVTMNRANNHGHEIECNSESCKPKTHAVILREGGEG